MFTAWLFWLFVLAGGAYMGVEAVRALGARGFDTGVAANAIVWMGCAAAAVPRVWKLATGPKPPVSH